jgi:hypothetical protein
MATVGYMEGTDPLTLTRLNLEGIGTLPLGNGFDGHGKYVGHLTKQDEVAVVITYLHKILPTPEMTIDSRDFLTACRTHKIPVLIIVPPDKYDLAKELLGDTASYVTLVAPEKLYAKALEVIRSGG